MEKKEQTKTRLVECPECAGQGFLPEVLGVPDCQRCRGTGRLRYARAS